MLSIEEHNSFIEQSNYHHRKNLLEAALNDAIFQQKELQIDRSNYVHMINRLSKDTLSINAKLKALQKCYDSKEKHLLEEQNRTRIAGEENLQAKKGLIKLMDVVEEEQKKRKLSIMHIKNQIALNELEDEEKEESLKKRQEIVETAGEDAGDPLEKKIQKKILANKLWTYFLKVKMEKEMEKIAPNEQLFLKIKNETGIFDIQEVLKRYLSRENNFSNNRSEILELEEKVKEIKEVEKKLKTILEEKDKKGVDLTIDNEKINNMLNDLSQNTRDNLFLDEQIANHRLVIGEIKEWLQKVKLNLEVQLCNIEEPTLAQKIKDLNIENINDSIIILSEVLKEVSNKYISGKDKEITLKVFMNDFISDKFYNRIARVKPKLPKLLLRRQATTSTNRVKFSENLQQIKDSEGEENEIGLLK